MFTVTKKWLDQHKTSAGAYTQSQLEILGFGWPPPKGWKRSAVGIEITTNTATLFEIASRNSRDTTLSKCLQLIKKLNNTELELLSDACKASISYRENKSKQSPIGA